MMMTTDVFIVQSPILMSAGEKVLVVFNCETVADRRPATFSGEMELEDASRLRAASVASVPTQRLTFNDAPEPPT